MVVCLTVCEFHGNIHTEIKSDGNTRGGKEQLDWKDVHNERSTTKWCGVSNGQIDCKE